MKAEMFKGKEAETRAWWCGSVVELTGMRP